MKRKAGLTNSTSPLTWMDEEVEDKSITDLERMLLLCVKGEGEAEGEGDV